MNEFTFTPASPFSLAIFGLILLVVVAAMIGSVYLAQRRLGRAAQSITQRFVIGLAIWLGIIAVVVQSGFVEAAPMPRLVIFGIVVNVSALVFFASRIGRSLAKGLTLTELVAFQVFRLPLELVLHSWVSQGTIPAAMSWNGLNFDIVSGVVALVAAPFANRFRFAAWGANIIGLALLLNVMRVAVMTEPLPFSWPVEPPLQLAFHLPYAFILPICVAGALAWHLILTAKLLRRAFLS